MEGQQRNIIKSKKNRLKRLENIPLNLFAFIMNKANLLSIMGFNAIEIKLEKPITINENR